jgi:hypothetical protein
MARSSVTRGEWIGLGAIALATAGIIYAVKPIDHNTYAPALRPVSLDEATRFGDEIASALQGCHRSVLAAMVDQRLLAMRAADDAGLQGAERLGFVGGAAFTSLTEGLCEPDDDVQYAALRVRQVDGRPTPLLRALADDELNYLQFTLTKNDRGDVVAADIYMFATGESIGHSMGAVARAAILSGDDDIDLDALDERLAHRLAEGDLVGAERLLDDLPPSLRDSKLVRVKRLRVLAHPPGEFASAATDFAQRFPNDPALAMAALDAYMARQDWPAALDHAARLDAMVEGDAHLMGLRATFLARSGRGDEAVPLARAALTREPTLHSAWNSLVSVLAAMRQHDAVARALDEMSARLGLQLGAEGLAEVDFLQTFLASPEGKVWSVAHP